MESNTSRPARKIPNYEAIIAVSASVIALAILGLLTMTGHVVAIVGLAVNGTVVLIGVGALLVIGSANVMENIQSRAFLRRNSQENQDIILAMQRSQTEQARTQGQLSRNALDLAERSQKMLNAPAQEAYDPMGLVSYEEGIFADLDTMEE